MTHPVTSTAKYKEFESLDALAKALINSRSDIAWKGTFRTLAAKIGLLDKGTVTWWRNLPEQSQALAYFLEIPVEDLGVAAQSASFVVSFSDFPALKPLDLKREAPWQLGREVLDISQAKSEYGVETLEEWLEPDPASWRPPSEFSWLRVDSNIEQQLLTQNLTAAGRFDVVSAQTLIDTAEQLRGGKPLVVSVSESGGDADWLALADRPDSAGLLVIAPFAFPVRGGTSAAGFYDWERLALRGRDRRKFDLTAPGPIGEFKRWKWTLRPNWRVDLLTWVEARLNRSEADTIFAADGAEKWLNRFDPQSTWFSTPSDVLQLCQIMHTVAYTKLPNPSNKDGGMKLAKLLFKVGPAYRHTQLAQLAHNRWDNRDIPWNGSLPMDVWLSFSPDSLAAVSPAALTEIARGTNLVAVKKEIERLKISAELGDPNALLTSGLIQANLSGEYDFQLRTVAALLVRDRLVHQVANEAAASWGWACFDAERRPVVDAVLDSISLEQLLAAGQRLVSEQTTEELTGSAAIIGASEALFMAVGRRISDGESIHAGDMTPLAKVVTARLNMASAEWELPPPWSRPMQTDDDKLQWITACWAWSQLPNAEAPVDSWLFPGWCQTLPEVPLWVSELWCAEKYEPATPAWLRFLSVVDEWLKEVAEPMANAPRALHTGLLARAAAGQWLPELKWWESVLACFWSQQALIERLEALGARDAPQIALRLWPSWLAFERSFPADKKWILTISRTRRWLLETMSAADAVAMLKDDDLWYLVGMPSALPPDFRPLLLKQFMPLLLAALEQNPRAINYGEEVEFFERFGEGVAPLLFDLLAYDRLSSAAATCLWRWNADAAIQRLTNPQQLSAVARQHLLMTCPATHLSVAAEVLKANPELFDLPDLASWARQHLPHAGKNSQALLVVLNAVQTADSQA